ncbi:hypothetical protein GCM10029964_119460 [Kibdelosporangium lantanae]
MVGLLWGVGVYVGCSFIATANSLDYVNGWYPILAAVVGVVLAVVLNRRHYLRITDSGLSVENRGYRVSLRWEDFAEVTRRRAGMFRVDALVFRVGHVEPTTRRKVPLRVHARGLDHVVRIGVYDRNWRTGEVGQRLGLGAAGPWEPAA